MFRNPPGDHAARLIEAAGLKGRRSCRVTGTPLRSELRAVSRPSDFGLSDELPTLLVLGGSQGAQAPQRIDQVVLVEGLERA